MACLVQDELTYLGHTYHADDYALIHTVEGPATVGQIIMFHNQRALSAAVTLSSYDRSN